ncbi:MAG: hypothetical protein EBQ78_01730, partial [Betaproteobacteria bacterium]|nr:hypothetical protein [Betaproteobacteria bacterium]
MSHPSDHRTTQTLSQPTRSLKLALASALAVALALNAGAIEAKTVRIGNQGDALSMDPHSLNESLQLSVMSNVYESLVTRNKDLSLVPALATNWRQTSPNVWRFELRQGVKFQDGETFTAEDVVFTFKRAAGDGSDMKSYVNDIQEVRKLSDYSIEIETKAPFPILPDVIEKLYIMNKKWCETNRAT